MSFGMNEIEDVKNVTFSRCISSANTPRLPFYVNLNNIPFAPDFVALRSITITTDTAAAGSLYLLYSNLINDYICSFPGVSSRGQIDSLIATRKPVQQIEFNIQQVDTSGTGTIIAPTLTGTWYLSLTMDFIKLKNRNNQKVEFTLGHN